MMDFRNIMLISPNKIKEYGVLNLNVDDTSIGNAIRISQNVYLVDIIGLNLVQRLQELVYNKINNISADTIDDNDNIAYKTLLKEFLEPVLVYRTAVEMAVLNTLKIRNMGVIKNSDVNVNAVQASEYKYLKDYNNTLFYDAVNKMITFLCDNKDAFEELPEGFCTCSRKPLYANNNLWLG